MTKDQFQRAASLSADFAERWYPHLVSTMAEFDVTTPARQAAFIAQIGTESGGFKTLSESFNYSNAGLSVFGNRLTASQREQLGRRNGEGPLSLERQRAGHRSYQRSGPALAGRIRGAVDGLVLEGQQLQALCRLRRLHRADEVHQRRHQRAARPSGPLAQKALG